jgi:hypothetical protein
MSLLPQSRSTAATPSCATAHLVPFAVEPSGDGPYVEALRDWIERCSPRPRGPSLRLVR